MCERAQQHLCLQSLISEAAGKGEVIGLYKQITWEGTIKIEKKRHDCLVIFDEGMVFSKFARMHLRGWFRKQHYCKRIWTFAVNS